MKKPAKTPLTIPVEILGLDDIKVSESFLNEANEVIIRAESTKSEIRCRRCNQECDAHGVGALMKIRHLPVFGYKTYIEMRPLRGICKKCNDKTTTQQLSWHKQNSRYTAPYEKHILLSVVNSTIADVSIREEVSDTAIQNMINKHIDQEVDWRQIKKIGLLGIDEISLKKGYQDYITVITSRINNKNIIIAVIRGREKAKIKAFLSSIPKKKCKTIVAVCCDMYEGYVNAAKEVFGKKVPIVIDRFHVAKLYRKDLVRIRKKELERLRKELSSEEYKKLQPAISLLIKKQELYTKQDKQQLELLFHYSPAIKAAYKLARQLTSIFNTHHRKKTAVKKLNAWIESVHASEVPCFERFTGTLEKYCDTIANYFIKRNTSGFVEGINNKLKVLKRRCYGLTNIKNLFQRIFLDLQGYDILLDNQSVAA